MDKWEEIEETGESLIDRIKNSNGKDFLKSIDHLKKIVPNLDEKDLDRLAHAVSQRLVHERHPLILRGGIAALGIMTAGVTARVTLEAIARAPEKYPNWMWAPAVETLLRLGWGSKFTKHLLSVVRNEQIPLKKRLAIVESINAFSAIGHQIARDEAMVEEALPTIQPPIRDAFVTLLNWARK